MVQGLTGQIEAHGDAFGLKPNEEGLRGGDQFRRGFGGSLAGDALDKGGSGKTCLRGTRQEDS